VPLHGRMTDDTDMLATMSKLAALNFSDKQLNTFAEAIVRMRSRTSDGVLRFGSLCSGSGLGDLALHSVLETLNRSNASIGDMHCSFVCEVDPKKAQWLINLGVADLVFKDVVQMGLEMAPEWTTKSSQHVPDVQFIFFGFSCKDLSLMNVLVDSMTAYVIEVLTRFLANPDAPEFHPHELVANPLQGTTASTLIGALLYIRRCLPELVLMENVLGVQCIVPLIREFLQKLGYCFFCSDTLDPKMFSCPNNRPRIYLGGKRSMSVVTPSTFGADFKQQLHNFINSFKEEAPLMLESFLLPAESPYFLQLASSGQGDDTSANEKWPSLHEQVFSAAGLARPSAALLRSFADGLPSQGMRQWLAAQTLRVQEIVYYASCTIPSAGPEVAVDVSQSIDRVRVCLDEAGDIRLGTFTARTQIWLVRSRRFFSGRERLAMHGISRAFLSRHADDMLLGDMAGNSFSASCFLVAFLSCCR